MRTIKIAINWIYLSLDPIKDQKNISKSQTKNLVGKNKKIKKHQQRKNFVNRLRKNFFFISFLFYDTDKIIRKS